MRIADIRETSIALNSALKNSSIDFYTFLRSDYYQQRRNQLREALGLPPAVESPATPGAVVGAPTTLGPGVASPAYTIPPPQ